MSFRFSFPTHSSTRADRLLRLLSDYEWHTTRELTAKVGHTFAQAKYYLKQHGFPIEREPHPSLRHQHRYRLRRKESVR